MQTCRVLSGPAVLPPAHFKPVKPRLFQSSRAHTAVGCRRRADRRRLVIQNGLLNLYNIYHSNPAGAALAAPPPFSEFIAATAIYAYALPFLAAGLVLQLTTFMARRAEQSTARGGSPGNLGIIPLAASGPMRTLLPTLLLTTWARNTLNALDIWVHAYHPQLPPWADSALHQVCEAISTVDITLGKAYMLALVVFAVWVFQRWKEVALQQVLGSLSADDDDGENQELRRMAVALGGVLGWIGVVIGGMVGARALGLDLRPLLAVGGAATLAISLASQTLITNAISALSIFVARPFVVGEHVTLQGGGVNISGTIAAILPLRTMLRTEEAVLVALPNKLVAEAVVYNRSRSLGYAAQCPITRLVIMGVAGNTLRLRIKVPGKNVDEGLSQRVREAVSQACDAVGSLGSPSPAAITLQVAKFVDSGVELVVKVPVMLKLNADVNVESVQQVLLAIANRLQATGAVLLS